MVWQWPWSWRRDRSVLNILALSDIEIPAVYSTRILERFGHVNLVVACGDLPHYYLEYVISMLNVPVYYVNGNHVEEIKLADDEVQDKPWGATNLHRQVIRQKQNGLLLAGIEGSLRYNRGKHQYNQFQMWRITLGLVPRLLLNKVLYGRYLDIFVTHSAPEGIHDDTDRAHRGVKAFRWLIRIFRPALALHGHVHLYNPLIPRETVFHGTRVINAYGYREVTFDLPGRGKNAPAQAQTTQPS